MPFLSWLLHKNGASQLLFSVAHLRIWFPIRLKWRQMTKFATVPSLSVSNWEELMTLGQLSLLFWWPSPSLNNKTKFASDFHWTAIICKIALHSIQQQHCCLTKTCLLTHILIHSHGKGQVLTIFSKMIKSRIKILIFLQFFFCVRSQLNSWWMSAYVSMLSSQVSPTRSSSESDCNQEKEKVSVLKI